MLVKIGTLEQFEDLLKKDGCFFLLKHSLTCPISQTAFEEYEKFASEGNEVPAYYLAVQEARALSNTIADTFQIKHESPQAILFSNGKALWNASHWKITFSTLTNAMTENK